MVQQERIAHPLFDELVARGVIDGDAVSGRRNDKLLRLLDPASRDNLGRRLAP